MYSALMLWIVSQHKYKKHGKYRAFCCYEAVQVTYSRQLFAVREEITSVSFSNERLEVMWKPTSPTINSAA